MRIAKKVIKKRNSEKDLHYQAIKHITRHCIRRGTNKWNNGKQDPRSGFQHI